ncbi:hypothetical protein [Bradyrhizobium sp. BR 1432]|uniref:hypothetical protein n=1 Tax=Bradyrhizobium sp. BR 1432 TaxID=3447966 RepID=UPI003EE6DFE5
MKRKKLTGRIVPPKGDGPFLLYRSLVYPVDPSQFDASRWPAIEPPPAELSELRSPTVLYKGTYYAVELTPEAMAAMNEPWLELARAIGRAEALDEFNRQRERQRQALIDRTKTD